MGKKGIEGRNSRKGSFSELVLRGRIQDEDPSGWILSIIRVFTLLDHDSSVPSSETVPSPCVIPILDPFTVTLLFLTLSTVSVILLR